MNGQETILRKHKFNRDDITIIAMLRQFEIQPSMREIARYIGIKSEGTIRYKMAWLEANGYIVRHGHRAVTVTEKGMDVYPEFVVILAEDRPPIEPVTIG